MRHGRAEEDHRGVRDHAGGRLAVAAPGPNRAAGTGDRHQRRAHLVHDVENGLARGRESVEGPRGAAVFLLLGAGLEVPRVFPHRLAFQDQAHITGGMSAFIPWKFDIYVK